MFSSYNVSSIGRASICPNVGSTPVLFAQGLSSHIFVLLQATHALQDRRKSPRCTHWCFKSFVLAVILLSCLSIALTGFTVGRTQQGDSSAAPESIFTKRLAFSSCTQRHMGENEIWEKVRCSSSGTYKLLYQLPCRVHPACTLASSTVTRIPSDQSS